MSFDQDTNYSKNRYSWKHMSLDQDSNFFSQRTGMPTATSLRQEGPGTGLVSHSHCWFGLSWLHADITNCGELGLPDTSAQRPLITWNNCFKSCTCIKRNIGKGVVCVCVMILVTGGEEEDILRYCKNGERKKWPRFGEYQGRILRISNISRHHVIKFL